MFELFPTKFSGFFPILKHNLKHGVMVKLLEHEVSC